MRNENPKDKRHSIHQKKRAHWAILTLDDLPKTDGKYSLLIAQLQARYQAKASGDINLRQKTEDFSI